MIPPMSLGKFSGTGMREAAPAENGALLLRPFKSRVRNAHPVEPQQMELGVAVSAAQRLADRRQAVAQLVEQLQDSLLVGRRQLTVGQNSLGVQRAALLRIVPQ